MLGKVLVVDDSMMNVELLSDLVARVPGLEPVGFQDPVAALEWCRDGAPILILSDFEMPRLNGAQFVAKLRETEAGAIIPIIIVTAYSDRKKLLKALSAGATDFIRKPLDEVEVMARVRSLSQLGRASRQIATQAVTDELTGLATRRHFLSRLEEEIAGARRTGAGLSVVLFDVDHFKRINDTGGHAAGDAVLRELSSRTLSLIRGTDTVGRLGGEEFGWILPGASIGDAADAAERLRQKFSAGPFDTDRRVTASFGVTTLKRADDAARLLRRADKHLYRAKDSGRNCVIGDARAKGKATLSHA